MTSFLMSNVRAEAGFNTLEAKIEGEVGASQVRAAIAVMSRVQELSEAVSPL